MNVLKSIIVWLVGIAYVIFFFPLTFLIWLLVLLLPIWKIRIEGREKGLKETSFVIISNHQSILDILLINCLRYRFKWISKIENVRVPFLGWYLRMANYITVDRGNEES